MTLVFVSTEPEICHILSKQFSQHSCFVFSDLEKLFQMIYGLKIIPDLLVMDYLTFNHDIYNIYEDMERHSVYIPLIFYNDPTLTLPNRFLHWKHILEYEKPVSSDFKLTDEHIQILQKIQDFVESETFAPFIPLMQKPKPLPKEIREFDEYTKMINLRTEKNLDYLSKKLSENQLFLFNIFLKNINDFISLETILEEYKKEDKPMSEESLKVVISRLKSKLKKLNKTGYYIQSNNHTYKLIET